MNTLFFFIPQSECKISDLCWEKNADKLGWEPQARPIYNFGGKKTGFFLFHGAWSINQNDTAP